MYFEINIFRVTDIITSLIDKFQEFKKKLELLVITPEPLWISQRSTDDIESKGL